MSYILDALKRAEQQRGGPARGATSLPRAMASDFAPRARWPWIVGGLGGLAVVVVATLVFWPGRQPAGTDATPATIVAGPPPTPVASPAPRVEPALPAPTPPAPRAEPAPAVRPAPAASSTSEAVRVVAPPAPPPAPRAAEPRPAESRAIESRAAEPRPVESRPAAPGLVEPRAPAPRPAAPSAVSRPTPPVAASRGTAGRSAVVPAPEERSRTAPPPAATTAERPVPPSPPVARAAPSRAAAPEPPAAAAAAPSGDLKALAAKLSIQVLSWAPERKDRFVFLNGRKYGEGQTVEDKIVVEQINEDSVVLAYQGERMILKGR